MKLLHHSGRYLLLFCCFALPAGVGLLYLTLRHVVDEEQDELLRESASGLVRQWTAHGMPADSSLVLGDDALFIHAASGVPAGPAYRDTSIWDADEQESEPARLYRFTTPDIDGRRYDVSITHSILDGEELLFSALVAMGSLFALLLAAVLWFNRFTARRLWQPFYDTLAALSRFNIATDAAPVLPEQTRVDEFSALNRALNAMSRRIAGDFQAMRDFTGNAAHEIQTPLAVIQNKAELLLQQEHLAEPALQLIADIHRSAHRLARLNRALLFLHKIENQQFRESARVDLKTLIEEKLEHLADALTTKNIRLNKALEPVSCLMHPALADALLGNLLGNAIKHNLPTGGQIDVSLSPLRLLLRNTGPALTLPPEQLFERFRKGDAGTGDSPGLGLSIVAEICRLYGFETEYRFEAGWHEVEVKFSEQP